MSLINSKNGRGAKTVLCGTPDRTGYHDSLQYPLITTTWDLSDGKFTIQLNKFPIIP